MQIDGFQDKVAFITGAEGIGAATARRLAREGARVAVLSRTPEDIQDLVDEIEAGGGTACGIAGDISDADSMRDAYAKLIDTYGRLDIVFANAGINGKWAPLDELTVEEWTKTININLNGTFHTVKFAVPHLKERGGAIVITASVNGTRMFSNSGASAYATTKAGQLAFAKMIAPELAQDKIRVNVVCPGAIDTEIEDNTYREDIEEARYPVEYPQGKIPLTGGEPGTSDQVADLVLFLCSDAAAHITGTPVWIDGAQSLLQG